MKHLIILMLLLLVMPALAACGGKAPQTENETTPVVNETVLANDAFDFTPESMTVPAGADVTISLENEGSLEHSWVLVAQDVNVAEATEADAINGASSGNIAGGETGSFSFKAPAPGTYQVVCTVPGHALGGMLGSFTVEE